MKPKSIISLIVAAVFVLGGIITCIVASFIASSEGVMLFPEADSEGNLVYRMDLTNTTKVNIDTADADILVKGGAEKSYVEVVNFNANYYKLTNSNGSLNFAQVDDFMSMFKFWDNGFSFKGMRYILRFGDDAPNGKRIIINLRDDDVIRLVDLATDTGTISIEDCRYAADYTLSANSGNITATNVIGASSLSIYGESAVAEAKNVSADKIDVSIKHPESVLDNITSKEAVLTSDGGQLAVKNSMIDKLSVTTVSGNISISPICTPEGTIITESGAVSLSLETTDNVETAVATANGRISVNGEYKESFALTAAISSHKMNITTVGGDVTVTYPVQ